MSRKDIENEHQLHELLNRFCVHLISLHNELLAFLSRVNNMEESHCKLHEFKLQKGGAAVNDNGRIGFLNEGLTDYFWTEIRDGDLWTLVYSITNNLDTDIYGIERRVRNYYSCRCIKD